MPATHKNAPEGPEIRRNRNGDEHIGSCSGASAAYKHDSKYSNVHHIVCISAMADGTIKGYVTDDAFKFITNIFLETDWNINAGPNVMGLPKKLAYVDNGAPADWDGWACHQVDHDSYLGKVSDRLNEQIWNTCQDVAKACKLTGESVAGQLKNESAFWRGKLSGRPTKQAWEIRFDSAGNPNPLWFWPFSMDIDDARPRKPPPDWTKNFSSSMVSRLSELFAML